MPADRRSFHDPVESILYLDSSFVIAMISDTSAFHADCCAFSDRLKREGALPVISDFVFDEGVFWIVKNRLLQEARRGGRPWKQLKRDRPELVRSAIVDAEQERTNLEERTLKLPIPDSVTDRAFQLMHDYALLPADAYHIATALENEVKSFVTLDQDFLDVEEITVYTCLP